MISTNRIWFVNRFFYPDHSATSQLLSDLAFHLAGQGRRIGVIASRGVYDDPKVDLPAFEEYRGVAVHRVSRPRFGRDKLLGRAGDYVGMYAAFAGAAARFTQTGDIIVVKSDPPMLSVAIAPVARAKRLRQVNWLQDLYPEVALELGVQALRPLAPGAGGGARNASLKFAAFNVAIGERMSDRLKLCGAPPERIRIVSNWCDDEAIRSLPRESNPLREAWGLQGKFVVGYSGNLGRAHEYATLLSAAEQLREEENILFLLIGGGHLIGRLQAEIERKGPDFEVSISSVSGRESSAAIPVGFRRPLGFVASGDGGTDRPEQILWDRRGRSPDHRRLRSGGRDRGARPAPRLRARGGAGGRVWFRRGHPLARAGSPARRRNGDKRAKHARPMLFETFLPRPLGRRVRLIGKTARRHHLRRAVRFGAFGNELAGVAVVGGEPATPARIGGSSWRFP